MLHRNHSNYAKTHLGFTLRVPPGFLPRNIGIGWGDRKGTPSQMNLSSPFAAFSSSSPPGMQHLQDLTWEAAAIPSTQSSPKNPAQPPRFSGAQVTPFLWCPREKRRDEHGKSSKIPTQVSVCSLAAIPAFLLRLENPKQLLGFTMFYFILLILTREIHVHYFLKPW